MIIYNKCDFKVYFTKICVMRISFLYSAILMVFFISCSPNTKSIEKDEKVKNKSEYNNSVTNNIAKDELRNSKDFKVFLTAFLDEVYSSRKFDSLLYISSPELLFYTDKKLTDFGRFYNPGSFCILFKSNGFKYNFNEGYFGDIEPDISKFPYVENKCPEGGFCDIAISSDGIYYKKVTELPRDINVETGELISSPELYKNLRK